MNKLLLILPFIVFLIVACESEIQQVKDGGLVELTGNDNSNSDLIRNELSAQNDGDTVNVPRIEFETTIHDFGVITEGDRIEYFYKFTNTGKKPLIIKSATATCGCTIPKPSKKPIAPGEMGEIPVMFNSSGKGGKISKTITVTSNAYPNVSKVKLVGEVTEK